MSRDARHYWTTLTLWILLLSGSSRLEAQSLPATADPVEKFRRVLAEQGTVGLPREKALGDCCEKLVDLEQVRRALLLAEWGDLSVDARRASMDRGVRNYLCERFIHGARHFLVQGEPAAQTAVVQMLYEMGYTVRDGRSKRGLAQQMTSEIAQLTRSSAPSVRQAAIKALGRINAEPSTVLPILNALCESSDLEQSRAGLSALTDLIRVSCHLANRAEPIPGIELTRADCVSTLCSALPTIQRACSHTEPAHRWLAVMAIEKVGSTLSDLAPEADKAQQADELQPLLLALQETTRTLHKVQNDPDATVRLAARKSLQSIGLAQEQVHRRLQLTTEPGLQQSKFSPESKPNLPEHAQQTLADLAKSLHDPDPKARLAALEVFDTLGTPTRSMLPILLKTLQDNNQFVRWTTVRILSKFAPEASTEVVPALVRRLQDTDFDVRLAAALALEKYGPACKCVLAEVKQALRSPDHEMRLAMLRVLAQLGSEAEPAAPEISACLTDKRPEVRVGAAQLLGKLGARSLPYMPYLRAALRDPQPEVRQAAGSAIVQITAQSSQK